MNRYMAIEADHSRATVGHWCDNCAMPTLVVVPIVAITEEGVTECGTVSCCVECGEDEDGGLG